MAAAAFTSPSRSSLSESLAMDGRAHNRDDGRCARANRTHPMTDYACERGPLCKELVVSNRKKADIVEELRRKEFRPFPRGDTEGVEDNDEAEVATGASTDYNYLLSMAIWSLTKERYV
ncbi:hypothetical protein BC826DRAFT_972412 [Russula brevipes]|nr:hypothetical protein BC826DRAFT_972412 [Russula brevipes]